MDANQAEGSLTPPPLNLHAIPPGPVTLPANATSVSDVDEEIFLLYTRLAALKPPDSSDIGHFHGLGSENSKEDALLVRIELKPPLTTYEPKPAHMSETLNRNTGRRNRARKRKGSGSNITIGHREQCEPIVLEYQLFQDTTALRSRGGDTGSVLWKARCVTYTYPASKVLRQLHFPEPESARPGLFDYAKLSQAHILELGAGTGLLALGISPLVRRYTATDVPALLPLLRKNLLSMPPTTPTNVIAAALDWTLPALRQVDVHADPPDVLLIVDCIYHPTLVRPLLATMTALARPRHTVALVVAELRAEGVLREFLQEWTGLGWRAWSVGEHFLGPRWSMWVAWREN